MVTGEMFASVAKSILPLNWGYIYGQSGAVWTAAKQEKLEQTTAAKYESGRKYGKKWIGHNVTDCSGLVVFICKKFGFSVPHGSNAIWRDSLSSKGAIKGNVPFGALVFKLRGNSDFYHVGVYVGGGRVVEAQGTIAGVVESSLSGWSHYGLLKKVEYSSDEKVKPLEEGLAVVDVPNDGTVNIREKASTGAKKLGTLKEGETCEVVNVSGEWAKVTYTKTGYIMTKYLKNVDK